MKPNNLFGICPDDEEVKKLSPWFRAWYGYSFEDAFNIELLQQNWKSLKNSINKIAEIDFRKPLSLLWNRRKEIIKSIRPKALIFRQTSRLTIYHAYKLPSDNPFIILSRPYGVPYIPASSVKGVVRFYFCMLGKMMGRIKVCSSKDVEDEQGPSEENDFQMLMNFMFGKGGENDATRGNVIFWDAVPYVEQKDYRLLDVDVINNHFSPYYGDKKDALPLDVYNPVPVLFVTIRKDTRWHFAFEVLSEPEELGDVMAEIRDFLKGEGCVSGPVGDRYLLNALLRDVMIWGMGTFGIGAKTRVEYGRMEYEKFSCCR